MKAEGLRIVAAAPEHLRFLQRRQLCNIHKASSHRWLCRWILKHETDYWKCSFHRPVVRSQISGCCHGDCVKFSMRFIKCGASTAPPGIGLIESSPSLVPARLQHFWSFQRTTTQGFRCDSAQRGGGGGGGDPSHICKILMTQCTYSNLLFFQDSFYLIIFWYVCIYICYVFSILYLI